MNRKFLKSIGLISIVMALVLGITGCGNSNGNSSQTAETKEKIVIHVGDQPPVFPVKIAEIKGYFAEELGENVTVEVTQFSSGPAIVEGYMANKVDFAISGDAPIIQGIAGGADIKIIAAPTESDKASALVATEKSGIKSLKDIKGKKIGVTLGSTYHQLLLIYLDSLGLTVDDISLINVPTAETMTALETNNIDAAVLNRQNTQTAVDKGIAHLVVTSEGYKYGVSAVSARVGFAKEHPELVEGFLRALNRATTFINENKAEATKLVAEKTGLSEKDLNANLEIQDYAFDFTTRKQESVKQSADFAYKAGLIKKELSLADLIDVSYLEAAVQKK